MRLSEGLSSHAILAIALTVLTASCVSRTPYPGTWDAHSHDAAWCTSPSGMFANFSSRSTPEGTDLNEPMLELKEVFFGNELNGFDVTHLSFDPLESGFVLVKPWVGEQVLEEERQLKRTRKPCRRGSWRVTSDWEALPGAAVAGLLWTGGIVMPMAISATYELNVTEAGDLTVHATVHTTGTTFVVFPMRTRDADEWFLYEFWKTRPETDATD